MTRELLAELLAGNDDHVGSAAAELAARRDGQRPPVVSVCCSDSRVSQEGMWSVDRPGFLFTAGNIGNRVSDVVDGERVLAGSVAYPLAHTGTEVLAVVGRSGLSAVGLDLMLAPEKLADPASMDQGVAELMAAMDLAYDLGRIPLAIRTGLVTVMRREGWGLTIAGSVVRYRRRVRMFQRVSMRSRMIGWDRRFIYLEQAMFRADGECTSHAIFRTAVTDANGIVAPERLCAALGIADASPPLPDWVVAWLKSEDARPWPPMTDTEAVRQDVAAQ
jgi:hypothetical protein